VIRELVGKTVVFDWGGSDILKCEVLNAEYVRDKLWFRASTENEPEVYVNPWYAQTITVIQEKENP
jgi:hypothetical protein